jgi:hypothetical protein
MQTGCLNYMTRLDVTVTGPKSTLWPGTVESIRSEREKGLAI